MSALRLACLGSIAAALVFRLAAAEGDWPRFRGPNGDGTTSSTTAPLEWSTERGVLWRTELPGPGASSPIVAGDRVFLTCYSGYGLSPENAGNPAELRRHALCVDLASGDILWNRTIASTVNETKYAGTYITMHGYASSTPATDGERVYFFLGSAGLHVFDLAGEPVWQKDLGRGVHDWGSGASPILHGDLVIVNAAMESDSLVALDKRTGVEVWKATGLPRAWNTPCLVEAPGGGTELVVSVRGKVRGFDPATGQELWSATGINAAELCPTAVAHDGVLYYLGHPRGEAVAVRAGGRGDVTKTHVLWRLNKGSNVSSPMYHDGRLYWTSDKQGIAYCVDAASGEIVYEQRIAPRPGMIYASPLLIGDRIYYVSRNSGTYVVAAGPEYRLLAHNTLDGDPGPFTGSPAVVEGKLLLRSDRALYCVGGP
jgi:outer membrane protein assembly factor BamB